MPVKVIHLSASDKGGAYKMAQNLVDAQIKLGLNAHHAIFTGKNSNVKISGFKALDNLIKFSLHAYEKLIFLFYEKEKSFRFKFSLGYPGIPFFLIKKIVQNYDIVHIHWINKGFINLKHLAKLNKKIVWTTHDIWAATGGCHLTMGCNYFETGCGNCLYLKTPKKNDLSSKLFLTKKHTIQNLDITFVAPSEWMRNNLLLSDITCNKPIVKILNGVDTSIFKYLPKKEKTKFTIGFVAANLNDENKALYRLANVINLITEKNKEIDLELLLIGEKKQDFEFQINVNIAHINYVKSAKEMAVQYHKMDLLCVTSTIETLPTTIIEAGCCGVPAIAFNVGGVSDTISKENGILITPFNIAEFANVILNFYSLKNQNKQKISLFMCEKYSLENTAKSYLNIY